MRRVFTGTRSSVRSVERAPTTHRHPARRPRGRQPASPSSPSAARGPGRGRAHPGRRRSPRATPAPTIDVTGTGCFLPDGVTGADGLLFQLIAPDGSAAASATLPVERDGTWDAPFVVPNGVPAADVRRPGHLHRPHVRGPRHPHRRHLHRHRRGPRRSPSGPRPRPASPNEIEPYPTYDGQSTCSPSAKPGMVAYRDMVMAAYPGTASYGISRDCGVGGTSEHKEGRAWDWANDATTAAGRRRVANFIRWLFATDQYGHRHAMARRLGVMYIIWNRRIFRMYRANEGWTAYTGSSPHTDHVHVSLTRRRRQQAHQLLDHAAGRAPAARRTSTRRRRPTRARGPSSSRPSATVDGDYDFAERGDFDGNGKLDILWYGQGAKPESIWWGRRGRGFAHGRAHRPRRLPPADRRLRRRRPHRHPLVRARRRRRTTSGTAAADRTWDTQPSSNIAARFPKSMVGDFDGDGRDDIFWYGPGDAAPTGSGSAGPTAASSTSRSTIAGTYRPGGRRLRRRRPRRRPLVRPGRHPGLPLLRPADRTFDPTERTIAFDARPARRRPQRQRHATTSSGTPPGDGKDKVWWGRGQPDVRAPAPSTT